MNTSLRRYSTILVGGGPAGLAVLLASTKVGKLGDILRDGLLILERSHEIGSGQIGTYAINSDSTGFTFVDPLRNCGQARLEAILETPVGRRTAAADQNCIPLADAGELMQLVGRALHDIIADYPASQVLTGFSAHSAYQNADGTWRLVATNADGTDYTFSTKNLILATGATQPSARIENESVAGEPLVARWGARLIQSGEALSTGGMAAIASRLQGQKNPKVAILGGSTSAMAVAHALLHRLPEISFGDAGVTIFHRRPIRVYYTSVGEALQDGYTEFGPEDLCPITQRVFRLAGLRLDSRELLMRVRGIGGRPAEPRVKLHLLQPEDPEAIRLIDHADLIIAALGYRPNALPLVDAACNEIPLFAHNSPSAPLVDDQCRVLHQNGLPISGVYAIGLAAGFVPRGEFGGEASFSGQANGLWLWQNDVGRIVVNAIAPYKQPNWKSPDRVAQASSRHLTNPSHVQTLSASAGTGA